MSRLILASGSESRAGLLRGAGLDVAIIPPRVDEDSAKIAMRAERLSPADQAMRLAELKAVKISRDQPGFVIGGDQMLACEGEAFDKPPSLAAASETLKKLQGRSHRLETAIVVAENGLVTWRHLARPRLSMRTLSDEDISRYLAAVGEDVLSTVGAYKLEGMGVQLFEAIEGDYFSILGLPLLPLLAHFRRRGVSGII